MDPIRDCCCGLHGLVFWLELAKDGPFIFSQKNARSKLQILQAHAIFLTMLLCGYRICTEIVPAMPFWMTDTFQLRGASRASFADIIGCLAALGMAYFERKWLYRERQIVCGRSASSLSDTLTTDDN